jgi:hypothetical protein
MQSREHRGGFRVRWLAVTVTAIAAIAGCAHRVDDIRAFADRRAQCDHFRGEEPYDKARAAFLREQTATYCSGTDAELAKLKQKYAQDPAAMKRLDSYEERIE